MGLADKHPLIRWAVPTAVVAVAAGTALAPSAVAEPVLPAKTAEQLLVDLQDPQVEAFSGTIESRTDLGLPELPLGQDGDFAALVSGTHTLRVWQDGESKSKVSLVDPGKESSVIRNGNEVWQWSSTEKTATHAVVPPHEDKQGEKPADAPKTPEEAAQKALAAVDPSTEVTVGRNSTVAGRSAYELVLDPKSPATLVDKVTLAVDAETNAPLRVEVWPTGDNAPAIDIGYTEISYETPDASVFEFTPAPDTKVTEAEKPADGASGKHEKPEGTKPTKVGEGWETITVAKKPEMPANTDPAAQRRADHRGQAADWNQLVQSLPQVSGSWGSGRVLNSSLVTVVITDDGRIAMGAMPTDRVVAALAG